MTLAVGVMNVLLGLAYCGYGVMTAVEMRRDWQFQGPSRFGVAWILMAFTCGPHHLLHGLHLLGGGIGGGVLDLTAVLVGLPAGLIWLLLRVEAFTGRRGDRFIPGTPTWVLALPSVAVAYVTALMAASLGVDFTGAERGGVETATIVANFLLVLLYLDIGRVLLRTQLRNRAPMGGWSLSGLALTAVFPTCALMHAVWALYAAAGQYHHTTEGWIVDWLSVPASVYFLWVIRSLHRDGAIDRGSAPAEAAGARGG